eukprot:COSAG02_NODE_20462_length_830_cov_2.157319_1_plen_87_part_10
MASMPSLSWQKSRKWSSGCASQRRDAAIREKSVTKLDCSRTRLLLLSADGASDTVKSEFLREHYSKEKATRVAQWRENETMGGDGNR